MREDENSLLCLVTPHSISNRAQSSLKLHWLFLVHLTSQGALHIGERALAMTEEGRGARFNDEEMCSSPQTVS